MQYEIVFTVILVFTAKYCVQWVIIILKFIEGQMRYISVSNHNRVYKNMEKWSDY